MVQINFALKEINCKIVYYGPGLSGKTTNLEIIHSKTPVENKGEMTSIATEGDRTLFFDFLPLSLGSVAGMKTKFQLYTVPGQVFYNSTRKLVLQGVDGIIFVADSRQGKIDENIESLDNLWENLNEYNINVKRLPIVLQYNKRDLDDIYSIEELEEKLNSTHLPYTEASALTGDGVFPTLKKLAGLVLENLNRQQASTTVRRPLRRPLMEKQTVMASASGGGKKSSVAEINSSPVKAEKEAAAPVLQTAGSSAKPQKNQECRVVRSQVKKGIKKIERKVPQPAKPKVEAYSTASKVAVKRGSAAIPKEEIQQSVKKRKKKSRAWIYLILSLFIILAGSAGALYYFGYLDLDKILTFIEKFKK